MRKFLLLIVFLGICISCNFNISYYEEHSPEFIEINLNDFGLENFNYTDDSLLNNYNTAANLARKSENFVYSLYDELYLYNLVASKRMDYFAGRTWYSSLDTIILFATYESNYTVFCELFINHGNENEKRILWGNYDINKKLAKFVIYDQIDTFKLEANFSEDFYYLSLKSLSIPFYLKTEYTDFYDYNFNFGGSDAEVFLFDDGSGKIKYYDAFIDTLWHCWDENHRDTECGKIQAISY